MYEQKRGALDKDVVVPDSALLQRERKDRYGRVDGLDNSELADPGGLKASDHGGFCKPLTYHENVLVEERALK